MTTTTTSTPDPEALPWDPRRGSLRCPGCPDHPYPAEAERYELALEGSLDGADDHRDVLAIMRRTPGILSGPFEIHSLPTGMAAIAVIDFLERQTFDACDTYTLVATLGQRFPAALLHVWPAPVDVDRRVAEDAYWDEASAYLIRGAMADIAQDEYPMDIGWRDDAAERINGPDGAPIELWRGYLYVELDGPGLVRLGWKDPPAHDTLPAIAAG